jgi:alkylated DNA repair dioxygenase AlkB
MDSDIDWKQRIASAIAVEPLWIDHQGLKVVYIADFLPASAALLATLQSEIAWATHQVRLFGRTYDAPRRSAWYGDPEAVYRYSGVRHTPLAWTPTLAALRAEFASLGLNFNSVLANLYRDGNDAMGWHADDEPELGAEPIIASLSLGATRDFCFKAKTGNYTCRIALASGSLLVMYGSTQRCFLHALPRRKDVHAPRLNLTFRSVNSAGHNIRER